MSKYHDYLAGPTPEGGRNRGLYDGVISGKRQGLPIEPLIGRARSNGLSDAEINTTVASALRYADAQEIHPCEGKAWRTLTPRKDKSAGSIPFDGVISVGAEEASVPGPRPDWRERDRSEFIRALFEPSDNISIVVKGGNGGKPANRGDTWTPEELADPNKTVAWTPTSRYGAWVRVNPLKKDGATDADVARFGHCLVESDDLPIDDQYRLLLASQLPVATLVHSGGKSIHALVKVGAKDAEEYATRVATVYAFLESAGYTVDKANRNPSRLSRLPGVMRGDNPQYLLHTDVGMPTYAAWLAWAQVTEEEPEPDDGLPQFEYVHEAMQNPPPLSEEMIHGILRRGHKGMLAGPSKSGKSFALLALAGAVSSGGKWFGHQCKQGNVLYVNLEIDRASLLDRLAKLGGHVKIDGTRIVVWNLRGVLKPEDPLGSMKEGLKRRIAAMKVPPDMIIFDPIYKIQNGDENAARDINLFLGHLDQIIAHSNAPCIFYAHHFAKGNAGAKASIDRASGSGVWARDPDALGTLTELVDNAGYQLEWVLREFRAPEPSNWVFSYPVHVPTTTDAKVKGKSGPSPKEGSSAIDIQFQLGINGPMKLEDLAKALKVGTDTVRRRVKKASEILQIVNGVVSYLPSPPEPATDDSNADDPTDRGVSA